MGKQGVDGVYSADPHKHPDAIKFDELTYDEYLARNLKVADATAISMARDYKLPMIFFSLDTDGTIVRVVSGENTPRRSLRPSVPVGPTRQSSPS